MPIQNVVVNAVDVQRSVDFYTRFLDAEVVGEPTSSRALLDLLTATIERRPAGATRSTWVPDDLQKGFRHIGFKVYRVDPRAEVLRRDGTRFHLDPRDAEGGVRICFFSDPDGGLLELVEEDQQDRRPQLDAPGFSHVHLGPGAIDGLSPLPGAEGVFVDPDGFAFTAARSTGPLE